MDSRELVDVSSFLLFEASGDSEQLESDPAIAVSGHGIIDADEDDAESCSCELSENIVLRVDDELDRLDSQGYDNYRDDHDDDDDEDEEDGIDQAWTSKPMGLGRLAFGSMPGGRKSKSVCVDSRKGESSETERSRLFWEACLASQV